MAEDALNRVAQPSNVYPGGRRKMILIVLCSLFANFLLGVVLLYIIIYPREPQYFETSINGIAVPIQVLDLPNQSDSSVKQWASLAATAVYTYDFGNYSAQLSSARPFFTEDGWGQFSAALIESNSIDTVVAKKLIVSAVVTSPVVISNKGMLNGSYAWGIQLQMLVTYQSASEFSQKSNIVKLIVVRVPTLNTPSGIGISSFVVTPAAGLI